MLKQKYFLTDFFILSAEKQPIKSSWRKIEWLLKTLRKTLLLLCTLASSFGLSAQTVSGKLVDEQNQPLPYANVVLLSLPDSAFVNGTISGEDGTNIAKPDSENSCRVSGLGGGHL